VLASVRPDQLNAGTPCASWDVHALINHFIGSARWVTATIGGFDEITDMDYAAGDFVASYDDNIKVAPAAFEYDGALEKTVTLSGLSSTVTGRVASTRGRTRTVLSLL
jgi:Mycothiol maleylpyruvate isomerase N-terminal domain